jgi:hypothetical protein
MYVHRSYEHVLPKSDLEFAKTALPSGFSYHVVKYHLRSRSLSFVNSPDFDTAPEPVVGESILVRTDGASNRRASSSDPEIYHHKWLMVADDYPGFDVGASKRRSAVWTQLPNVDRRRIGRKSYWEKNVLPRIGDGG